MSTASKQLKANAREHLRAMLVRLKEVKGRDRPGNDSTMLLRLQEWQQQRLAADYAGLRATPRFTAACTFFIEDLYGPQDFSQRDADIERIFPIMVRLLPPAVLGTVAQAVELDALSHELDRLTSQALPEGEPVSLQSYARAYQQATSTAQREHQLLLLLKLGRELDRLVRKPMLWDLLRMCRWPARMAGLNALQSFLERGFDAFRKLKGANPFLLYIVRRERAFMRELNALEAQRAAAATQGSEQLARSLAA
jgi:hypothetical protein